MMWGYYSSIGTLTIQKIRILLKKQNNSLSLPSKNGKK
jgi:hypothetical protein